jgi:hypothetical protein
MAHPGWPQTAAHAFPSYSFTGTVPVPVSDPPSASTPASSHPSSGSASHSTALDCNFCDAPIASSSSSASASALAFCCEEPDCLPLVEACEGGPACPSTSFVGWDDMLLDDCDQCAVGVGGAGPPEGGERVGGGSEACCPPWPGASLSLFGDCCAEGCFELPDLVLGGKPQEDSCPDCWSVGAGGMREDEWTESGSSVATPADRDMLSTSPRGLSDLMKGLDDKAIQEIVRSAPPFVRPVWLLADLVLSP